ncbi:hypothetical protein WDJ51_04340 [Rathayibacter sp. YIM 133350]|uniref:hypothetical protein n=1 Tax=Rathayibacter sp. YIM 133350 TaxID=3131992 RepID=UPI00307E71FA
MNYDNGFATAGIVGIILFIVLYLGVVALSLWVFYLIVRTAVTNGILRADQKRYDRGLPPR